MKKGLLIFQRAQQMLGAKLPSELLHQLEVILDGDEVTDSDKSGAASHKDECDAAGRQQSNPFAIWVNNGATEGDDEAKLTLAMACFRHGSNGAINQNWSELIEFIKSPVEPEETTPGVATPANDTKPEPLGMDADPLAVKPDAPAAKKSSKKGGK